MKTIALIFLLLIQCGLIVYALRILGTMLFLIIYHKKKLPFVPTRRSVIRMMVRNKYVHEGNMIVDLGCGTGTLCVAFARRFRTSRIVGVEREALLASVARVRTLRFGQRAEIICGDMFAYRDLDKADVVAGFWITELMPQIIEMLTRDCRTGTIILSHMFPLPEHERIQKIDTITQRGSTVHVYTIL